MNIVLCHNHYQQPGGEDRTFADEARLLESHGHAVTCFTLHNDDIAAMSRWELARKTLWNSESYRGLREVIQRAQPQVMHCTNTFPLISPAAYYAARDEQVPVVQSLHNYRMFCANSLFLRDGRVCEDCLGKRVPWPAVLHGCYRESHLATAGVTAMVGLHRWKKTWLDTVQLYCTPTEFARQKFIAGGLDPERVVVKPNFVAEDMGEGNGEGDYAVFVGRLSPEKGVEVLLDAWRRLPGETTLRIVGDGPLADRVAEAASRDKRIQWSGRKTARQVGQILGHARCVVLPSICYETFGRTVIEAYCKGTPVIASGQGAIAELVDEGQTGYLFEMGSTSQLIECLRRLDSPEVCRRMRQQARRAFERRYTAAHNYKLLMQVYDRAGQLRPAAGRRESAQAAGSRHPAALAGHQP